MTNSADEAHQAERSNRIGGLIFFGIVHLLLGGIAALLVPLMIFSMLAIPEGSEYAVAKMMIFTVFFYGGLAAWFITMGIGSILARKWARVLILVVSWTWLIIGVFTAICMIFVFPPMLDSMMSIEEELPDGINTLIMIFSFGFIFIFYVLIPGSFVLFYRSRNVKATCDTCDPKPRWTDACPLPVLGGCFLLTSFALGALGTGIYNWTVPFFGALASGPTGALLTIGTTLVLLYAVVRYLSAANQETPSCNASPGPDRNCCRDYLLE